MKPQGYIPASAAPGAHEASEVDHRLIFRLAIFIGVTLVVLLILMALLFKHLEGKYSARTSEAAPLVKLVDLPPTPRLQVDPLVDLQAVRAAEELHLTGYRWMDRPQGFAQIPIDRAMDLWVRNQSAAPSTKAAPVSMESQPPVTELQMRQQKAQEATHVP